MGVKPIVVGTDGSSQSLRAVEWAAVEAMLHDAPLRIVSALDLPARPDPEWTRGPGTGSVAETAEKALDAAAERADLVAPGLIVDARLVIGKPAQVLADAAAAAAMRVVGSQGAGNLTPFGSVSRHLAMNPPCPVVIERAEAERPLGRVVVGVHELDDSAAALAFAFDEASLYGAHLLAVHAWFWFRPTIGPVSGDRLGTDPRRVSSEALARLHQLLRPWREKYPDVEVGEQVVHARPGHALAAASAGADLVVLGSNGQHGHEAVAGPVIHALLRHAHCPVAVVPATERRWTR